MMKMPTSILVRHESLWFLDLLLGGLSVSVSISLSDTSELEISNILTLAEGWSGLLRRLNPSHNCFSKPDTAYTTASYKCIWDCRQSMTVRDFIILFLFHLSWPGCSTMTHIDHTKKSTENFFMLLTTLVQPFLLNFKLYLTFYSTCLTVFQWYFT